MFKRKTIRKIIFFLVIFSAGLIAFAWVYNNFFMEIDTSAIDGYYDLLTRHAKPAKYLMLNLGVKEEDDLQIAIDRLKKAMGLEDYRIWITHHDDPEKPPAYIETLGYGHMSISISNKITQKREEINVLTHELGHIYVWNLDKSILKGCNEEKVVDTSGIFLGLGILMLNGLTDDFFFIPGGEYHTEKKFFGYLSPVQFGYLLARYCAEHGIPEDNITPFLGSAGLKYFNMGRKYLARQNNVVHKSAEKVTGIYWCPKCGYRMLFSLEGKIKDLKCPKCSWALP